jgi:hypothetical protein
VEDLDEDAARAPADHGTGIELVHHGRAVLGAEELADRVAGFPDGRTAEPLVEPPLRELGAVDLLGQRVHARVVLVRDLRPLDRVPCRALAPARDRDQGLRDELRVPPLLLEVAERDVVERRVRGHGHHDAGRHLGVDERRGQDRDLARERVGDRLVHEHGAGDLLEDPDLVVLERELLGRLARDEPGLAVDLGPDVRHLRVHPEVGDAVDGLGPEGRGRHEGLAPAEHHEHEPDHLGLVALEKVVVADRVIAERAVPDGVGPADHVALLVQPAELPLDELAVVGVHGREPSPPVDREAGHPHHALVFVREVPDDLERVHEPIEHVGRDAVEVAIEPDRGLVAVRDPFRDPDHGRAGHVEGHRVEDAPSAHPPEPGDHVGDQVGAPVTDVHRARRVRVCDGQVELLSAGIGVRGERVAPPRPDRGFHRLHALSLHLLAPRLVAS